MKRLPIALSLSMALIACQQSPPPNTLPQTEARSLRLKQTQSDASTRPNYPAIEKNNAQGQVRLQGDQLTLSLELYPKASEADFQTQLLDLSNATRLQATVTDSRGKSYTANGADVNGTVAYTGGMMTLTFDNIVPDEVLLVEVQAKNGLTNIVQADLATVLAHTTSSSPVSGTLNFQTTVAAKAIKGLLQNGQQTRARAINLTGLDNLAERITGVSGTAPNFSYADVHPTLVNTALLATDLVATNPIGLTESDYRLNGATVNLNVSGLNGSDKVQVQITDAASAVQTNLGNGTRQVTGVTPGGPLQVTASAFGSPAQSYNYSVSPATINPTEGGSVNVTVTAAPAVNISGFLPSAGAVGTSVTINGSGFTGATAVTIGGANATFTVNSNTQITATVPVSAVDGVISVTQGGTVTSATAFDVFRRIHVKANASGSNNGTSWSNAYASLQVALSAAVAQDEIWIAAGTYTPHANDRSASFQMKENINIYGGFAGTESTLGDRTPSLADFVTILSGDLSGNDNYTTPGTSLDENSYHVTRGANNAVLDGVTIQGGYAGLGLTTDHFGAGMYNESVSPTLSNLTFSQNRALSHGGGLYNQNASPVMNNVNFTDNRASFNGGAIYSVNSTLNLTQVYLSSNSAATGGGMYNDATTAVLNDCGFSNNATTSGGGAGMFNASSSPTLSNVSFANNASVAGGGGLFNSASSPTLNNVTFSANSAQNGGGMLNSGAASAPTITNVRFMNNTAVLNGGGMFNDLASPALIDVVFSGNSATQNGGGLYSGGASSAMTLSEVSFLANSANNGGGAYNSGTSPVFAKVSFINNIATSAAGGMFNLNASPALSNVIFSGNSANEGGGMQNSSSSPSLTQVSFSNNLATTSGGGVYNTGASSPVVKNTLFYNSTRFAQSLDAPNGVIEASSNPYVDSANPNGPDGIPRTADDGLRIKSSASDVIDAGIDAGVATDILGNPRFGNPEPGAYEYTPPPPPANVLVVKHDATGANDGSSWSNAFTSLQSALAAANGTSKTEIWIAAGTYTPHASDRGVSFVMKENVNIYGGFAGTESALNNRTPSLTDFVTILSGDLDSNDDYSSTPATNITNNSYTILMGANNAILDGVTVRGANANGDDPLSFSGGGMYNDGTSPTVNNSVFTHNTAKNNGGALFVSNGITVTNTIFSNNIVTESQGGAISINGGLSTFNNVVFENNSTRGAAGRGGAVSDNSGNTVFNKVVFSGSSAYRGGALSTVSGGAYTDVTFLNNTAVSSGGAVYAVNSSAEFKNAVFSNNSANSEGGAIESLECCGATPPNLKLTNVTFSNNSTSGSGGGLFQDAGTAVMQNVVFFNSTRSGPETDNGGNIEAVTDPFIDSANPNGPDGIPRTADDGLRLKSSATDVINQGVSGAGVPATDILGNARVGSPEPGAYEYTP